MRKLITLCAAAVLAGVIGTSVIGSSQATPLTTAAGSANIERAMPSDGVTKAWYHGRHYGWYRGHHYGWRHRYWHRYAYWH